MDSILDMLEEPIMENSLLIAKQLIGKNVRVYLVMLTVIAFLLLTIYIMIKRVKRLPKYYGIEIIDIFGKKTVIYGLRLQFVTYDAAKSYSEFYANLYGNRYLFHVVGRNRIVDSVNERTDMLSRKKNT